MPSPGEARNLSIISSSPQALLPGVFLDGRRAGPDVRPAKAAAGSEGSSSSAPGGLEELRPLLLGVGQDLHEVGRDRLVEVGLTATVQLKIKAGLRIFLGHKSEPIYLDAPFRFGQKLST